MNFFLLCVVLLSLSMQTLDARRARRAPTAKTAFSIIENNIAVPALDIDRLTGQYRDVDALVEKAKRDAEHVKRQAKREKEALDSKVRRQQSRLERRREELLRKDLEQQLRLEEQVREEAAYAEKRAAEKAADIVREAERKAAELKVTIEEQEKTDQLNGKPVITKEWRHETMKDFEHDAGFLRQIVMEGEVSRVERQNFMALFTEQHAWFAGKVAQAEFFFDEAYNAAVAKKNNMAAVVDAQRQADDIILDLVAEYHFPAQVQAQLRLMALYEINNHIQHAEGKTLFLSSDVIANLVQKISLDVAPGQREITIVSEKEKVLALESRIAHMQEKMKELEAVAAGTTREGAVDTKADMLLLEQDIDALKRERERLLVQRMHEDQMHAKERLGLIEMVEKKQREKTELEIKLSQLAEHMRVLTTHSQARLMALAQKITDKKITQEQLTTALEVKARKQAELEVSLAQVNSQIAHLHKTTGDVVSALTHEINVQQDRCKTLGQLLDQKQQECVAFELHAQSVQEVNTQIAEQIAAYSDRIDQVQQDCSAHLAQIAQLQGALAELTHQKDYEIAAVSSEKQQLQAQVQLFNAQLQTIITQSQEEVVVLKKQIDEQQLELESRRKAYKKMETLQAKLEKIRRKREADVKNAAAHTHLLGKMATFGDSVLSDYNRLQQAAQNAREITKELSELLSMLSQCQSDAHPSEVVRGLESALQLLSETSTALNHLPAARPVVAE